MMSQAVKGHSLPEARALVQAFKALMSIEDGHDHEDDGQAEDGAPDVKLGDLEALQGVVKYPVRIKCATLAWNTLAQGLDDAETETGDPSAN